ncbi:MAG TPA: BrnT family toxin [bacterium]|nr:BrnT family toxin [bacterium]
MNDIYNALRACTGFEWDKHNIYKNWEKHRVTPTESEQVFFNQPLILADDAMHSGAEIRFYALGSSDRSRRLFISFTIRNLKIRVISSREMSKKEREEYEKHR